MGMMPIIVLLLLGVGVVAVLLLRRPVGGDAEAALRAETARRLSPSGGSERSSVGEREAYIVIPDISGYTRFMRLNHFSMAHAQYAISALLQSVIAAAGKLRPAKVEGDAVMLCGWCDSRPDAVSGDEVAATTADILNAFYNKRAELLRDNVCRCNACGNLEQLDLKIIVHRGVVFAYDLQGGEELSGLTVIVAHRLLKNKLGLDRYILVTEAASRDMSLEFLAEAQSFVETCDDVGEVAFNLYRFEPSDLAPDEPAAAARGLAARLADTTRKLRENLRPLRSGGVSANPPPST